MDIALLFKPGSPVGDIFLNGSDLGIDHDLETAVIVSLFTDKRAGEDDEPTEPDRRGWWGDTFSAVENDGTGSRLWLLSRSKEIQENVNLAKFYAEEALQWIVEDKIAESVTVDAKIIRKGVLGLEINIVKPTGVQVIHYQYAWNSQ